MTVSLSHRVVGVARQLRNAKLPIEKEDALLMWACIAAGQCARLREDLDHLRSLASDEPGDATQDEEAFYRVFGSSVFAISAANHVVALLDLDPRLGKLPHGVHGKIRTLRNVFEHWDAWPVDKSSAKAFRETFPGVWPYSLHFADGDLMIGGVLSFHDLQTTVTSLYSWLSETSPRRRRGFAAENPVTEYPLDDA